MTYEQLQQRRWRIEAEVVKIAGLRTPAYDLIFALLGDADPKLWSYHPFAPAKMTPKLEQAMQDYDRALSTAERELGLASAQRPCTVPTNSEGEE